MTTVEDPAVTFSSVIVYTRACSFTWSSAWPLWFELGEVAYHNIIIVPSNTHTTLTWVVPTISGTIRLVVSCPLNLVGSARGILLSLALEEEV